MKISSMRGRSIVFLCAAFAVIMLLISLPGSAQTTSGTIVGTLTDSSGGVIPHTTVVLINVATATRMQTESDDSGYYQFFNVPPAVYKVTVTKQGFRQLSEGPFKLEVEGSLRVNLMLQVGAENETVTVTAESPLLRAENTTLGSVIDERQTVELPLNGRNPMNLTALVPSVVPQGQANGNTNSANPFAWGNYQIGGGMANQSATFIDGAPVNTAYINLTALVPTQDSLGEFKVDTNTLSAEYGRLAGGAIQFSTRSGSNNLHGAFWEYLRNKVLDANSWFNNHANPIVPRGSFTQNQFGLKAGGPIFIPRVYDGHNKSFFFFSWEGFYARQGQTFVNTVPTADELGGDMNLLPAVKGSPLSSGAPVIYDPLTTCTNSAGCSGDPTKGANFGDRLPFAGNVIPANRINQTAVNYIKKFYPVNAVGSNATLGNYTANAPIGGQNFQTVAKIDWNVSDKQHVMSRFTWWKNTNLPQDPLGTGMCQDRCTEDFKVYNWVLGDTYTFNPTTILDMRLSYQRFEYQRIAKDNTYKPSDIGQTLGNGSSPQFPGPLVVSINGFDTANTFGSGGADSTIGDYSDNDRIAGNLTKIIGKHTFKFGGEWQRNTFNYFQTNNSAGQTGSAVDGTFTQNNHAISTATQSFTGAGLATFLLGYTTSSINYLTVAPNTSLLLYPAVFATDDWRMSNKLTAHLGVRWEDNLPWTDRFNNISYWDDNVTNPILAAHNITSYKGSAEVVASSSRSSRSGQDPFHKEFSPRVGFSYAATPSTIVQGGYGLLWLPIDAGFNSSPNNDPINSFSTGTVATVDGGNTPAPSNHFDAPLPGGIIQPPKRSTDAVHGFQYVLLGQGATLNWPNNPYPYAQQWNLDVQRQLGPSAVVDVAYAGAKGTHLPWYSLSKSALPEKYFSADPANLSFLSASVPNPFYGVINPNYGLGAATMTNQHLVSPYPQYNGVGIASADYAGSTYHALQIKAQKRFTGGASIGAAYTFSKLISGTDTLTGWLESSAADNWGVVDPNRPQLEKSLSSNDVKNRLVANYVYDVPVGRGKKYLAGANRATDEILGGWGLQGITTLQSGFPLPFGESTNTNSTFGFGQRPSIVPGCDRTKKTGGPIETRTWFNTACFTQTPVLQFGESRNDSVVRIPGIDNWDMSVVKNFSIDPEGRAKVQFRTEFFNMFNRTQFGVPSSSLGSSNFGLNLNAQQNQPRLIQFALRIDY